MATNTIMIISYEYINLKKKIKATVQGKSFDVLHSLPFQIGNIEIKIYIYTFGAGRTRPSTCVKLGLIEMPHERSIGSASYLLLFRACKKNGLKTAHVKNSRTVLAMR
jgi:hypothetical protein